MSIPANPSPALIRRTKPTQPDEQDERFEMSAMNRNVPVSDENSSSRVQEEPAQGDQQQADRHSTALTRWWKQHIAPDVSHEQCRDFFALERTFLSYVRTANALASFGIVIAQLFRLPTTSVLDKNGNVDQSLISRFFQLGRPLGAAIEGLAIVVVVVGAVRCWRQQQRILDGRIVGGGWEILGVAGAVGAFLVVLLVLNTGDAATGKPV